ncbi:hypothetical protein Msi02_62040 [Microbispora siamensis]|uniref:Long-chain fatty acid--CoA ligase n=1 Tax=Microbispora siamensis TaxID=564413 RepID=A0ABQ4GVC7_9ACTN|nr:hypothetical protein Msi02_62040 [Microbispora siamensis]
MELRAVDPSGRDVEPGEVGELLLHGPEMMLGYVREELNAHAFTPDGWFRTGDLGSLAADGQVRITGRLKDVINRDPAESIAGALARLGGSAVV